MFIQLIDDRIFDKCEWDEEDRMDYKTMYCIATTEGGYYGPFKTIGEAIQYQMELQKQGEVNMLRLEFLIGIISVSAVISYGYLKLDRWISGKIDEYLNR